MLVMLENGHMMSAFDYSDVSSGEEDPPEAVEHDEETRELRIIDHNAFVSFNLINCQLHVGSNEGNY